jgi:hypothetical protein
MDNHIYDQLQQRLDQQGTGAAIDQLCDTLREEKD